MNPFALPQRFKRFQVEITTGCNLACAGCPRTIGIEEGHWHNKNMSVKRFAALVANAPKADILVLQGIGEPTLHPKLPDMISLARASKRFTYISFNTNALLRDLDYYVALRKLGLDHVSVSVDSLTPATAEATRSGTDVGRLREAVRFLVALFGPGTTISIVLSRMNLAELPDLLAELYSLGARVVEIQPLIAYAPALENVRLTATDIVQAKRITGEAMAKHAGLTIMHAPALTPSDRRCTRPMTAGYVTVEGMLTPCCTTEDTSLLGRANLVEHSFADLWQSPKVVSWYSRFFDHDDSICVGCTFNPQGLPRSDPASVDASPLARRAEAAAILQRQGHVDEAAAQFRAVLNEAGSVPALQGLGEVALQRGEYDPAMRMLDAVQHLAPSARNAHNLAWALHGVGRRDEAVTLMHRTVNENPDYPNAYYSLARLLEERGDRADAAGALIVLLRRALAARNVAVVDTAAAQLLALDVDHPRQIEAANLLRLGNRIDLATALLDAALRRHPDDLGAALVRCMARLPVVYADDSAIAASRRQYEADMVAFGAAVKSATQPTLMAAHDQVGQAKPFYLSYQGRDDRRLQEIYGDAVSHIVRAAVPPPPSPAPPPKPGERLRVGFASNYFFQHSVSKLFRGWIEQLDRQRFEIFVYNLFPGDPDDWATQTGLSADHVRHRVGDLKAWAAAIAGDRLHAVIFPEIGMESMALRLACLRLARIQCAAWGHPVTTGLPTIDYFLSSALMEPDDGESHYREKLVRLPNFSVYYEPLPADTGSLTRKSLGLGEEGVVYVCCQALYKYLPAHDHVFPAIAAKVPSAQFLFIADGNPATTETVRARLNRAFAARGLEGGRHLVFAPSVAPAEFPSLLRAGSIYLDSIDWSGGNTTLEAIACDLPIVTMPGELMRSRHSAGLLKRIGLDQFIARDAQAYVDLAVRLGNDAKARAEAGGLIAANRIKLYRDVESVRALEDFLLRSAAAAA
jgi:predicted O-linked N-acetylglucosamine transferase (SPINDLY family)/MoaA/NifB/PqqE/SkfB family radical SAM enzyme